MHSCENCLKNEKYIIIIIYILLFGNKRTLLKYTILNQK